MRVRPERATLLPRSLDGGPRPSGRYGATHHVCERIVRYAVYRTRSLEPWFPAEDRYQTAWVAILAAGPGLRRHGAQAYLALRAFGSIVDAHRKASGFTRLTGRMSRLDGALTRAEVAQALNVREATIARLDRRYEPGQEVFGGSLEIERMADPAPGPECSASFRRTVAWIDSLAPLDRDIALSLIDGTTQEELSADYGLHLSRISERWQWMKRQIRLRYAGIAGELSESDELALGCEDCAAKPFGEATPAAHILHLGDAERLALGMFRRGW